MRNKLLTLISCASFMVMGMSAGYSADTTQKTSGRTSQPIGHYEYCLAHVDDCDIRTISTKPVKLTKTRWSELVETNRYANAVIEPATDLENYGVEEFWTLPETVGDCEDYVLMKRKQLMALGWPASSLLATVVLQSNGDGHAVLTVRTHRGDFVLDNLSDEILAWNETDYRFLKRVSARHSGHWEGIIDTRTSVASIKRAE